jgi:hypothetical protein
MSLREEQMLFLKDTSKLLSFLWDHGFEVTVGEAFRTQEQQDIYIRTGRSKTTHSNHLLRCAIDLNIFIRGEICTKAQLEEVGKFWESLNPKNRWGGNFPSLVDTPHFERNVA